MNKEEVSELIEKLGGGDIISCQCTDTEEQVLIGDVFLVLDRDKYLQNRYSVKGKLCSLWAECGSSKSLQEIAEGSGWERANIHNNQTGCVVCKEMELHDYKKSCDTYQLKDSNARALFESLKDTFK